MEFVHIADMHLDAQFKMLSDKNGIGEQRRYDQRIIFKKIINYIKENNIRYLFISGDLYEHQTIRKSTIEYINDLFKEINETQIFITPGNHDPFLKNSYYNNFIWNDNVYIFTPELQKIETKEADIYGYGFGDFYCSNLNLNNLKIDNHNKINILIIHGTLDGANLEDMQYNSMSKKMLEEKGFNYIALGHIHKNNFTKNGKIIYPGSTIAMGFDELGEHGMVTGEILKQENKLKFIKLDDMEFEKKFAFNDSLNYNYYGLTGWLSSTNINSDFYNKIGYYSDNNMGFYNSYVLLDSLFGVKYYSAINKNKYYELIDTKQISILDDLLYGTSYIDNYLYRNPYALNLGYMVSNNAKTSLECNNGFECQNKMIKLMTNIEDDIYQVEEVNNEITITSKKDFYLLVDDSLFLDKSYKICIEKKCLDLNATSNRSILVENNYEIGDKLHITFDGDYNIDHLYIGYFDFEKFEKAYDKLKDNQLNITYFKENHIKGNVNVNDENVLLLTIPYNENFKILVDGQETSYYKVFDQFIGLDLENGTHDIEIIYEVKGLKLGIIISLISFVTFIIYLKKLKRNL